MPRRKPQHEIECLSLHGGTRRFAAADLRFRPAAYGVALNEEAAVLLGRSAFTGLLDLPGGAVDPWELLEDGLRREFHEETGVEPEPVRLVDFDESFFSVFQHPFHSLRFYYLVRLPAGGRLRPDGKEITALAWLHPRDRSERDFTPGTLPVIEKVLREHAP